MIEVRRRKRGISYAQKWFSRDARFRDSFRLVAYFQYRGGTPPGLFVRHPFSTVLIDLQREPEVIQADMHRNVRAEIRRADGEGISWEKGLAEDVFVEFHNSFARERGIMGIDVSQLRSFGSALLLTRATKGERTLAQHAYVVDPVESRARFLYSSSGRFEGTDSALVGRANRWCHWKDMIHLRSLGIRTYDLGGIAVGAGAEAVSGINDFKLRFGGATVREDHWFSLPYHLATLSGARQ
jgi:hypothetical protein